MSDATSAGYSSVQPGQEDPGRTLGIVGLVLAIVASVVGLIISIVAFRKSKKAGFSNGLAKAGIIVGIITTVFGLIMAGVGIAGAVTLMNACAELGPGVHQTGSGTITCG